MAHKENPFMDVASILLITTPYAMGIRPVGEITPDDVMQEIAGAKKQLQQLLDRPETIRRGFIDSVVSTFEQRVAIDFSYLRAPLGRALNLKEFN